MDIRQNEVRQNGRSLEWTFTWTEFIKMDAPQNWSTSMRDLAVLPLLQGLEHPHALFPVLGHNVAQSANT